MHKNSSQIPWSEIEASLDTLSPVRGGNTNAKRGVVTLPDSTKLFVKIGIDDQTKGWIAKEVQAYNFLAEYSFPHIPHFISVNEEGDGLALEALLSTDGWDWSDTWDDERLEKTLASMDALAEIQPDTCYYPLLVPVLSEKDNGWTKLMASEERQADLLAKLAAVGEVEIVGEIRAQFHASENFQMAFDTLVHHDVRADNCAWHAAKGVVKLVDWNWLQMGDRRIELAATLTHVQACGFDVLPKYAERLDAGALRWVAGYWLEAGSKPIWTGGPAKLRNTQLQSGMVALKLAREVG